MDCGTGHWNEGQHASGIASLAETSFRLWLHISMLSKAESASLVFLSHVSICPGRAHQLQAVEEFYGTTECPPSNVCPSRTGSMTVGILYNDFFFLI